MKQPLRIAIFALTHRIELFICLAHNKGLTRTAVLPRLHRLLPRGEKSTFRCKGGFFFFKKIAYKHGLEAPQQLKQHLYDP